MGTPRFYIKYITSSGDSATVTIGSDAKKMELNGGEITNSGNGYALLFEDDPFGNRDFELTIGDTTIRAMQEDIYSVSGGNHVNLYWFEGYEPVQKDDGFWYLES